jgi:hypothetical protein
VEEVFSFDRIVRKRILEILKVSFRAAAFLNAVSDFINSRQIDALQNCAPDGCDRALAIMNRPENRLSQERVAILMPP